MATMSFGALFKAKRVLAAKEPSDSGEGSSEETDEDQSGEELSDRDERKEVKKPKEKRANKHA
jgi:hypothetical protein